MRGSGAWWVVLFLVGCAHAPVEAWATQPRPTSEDESSHESDTLFIFQRDMDLPMDFRLRSAAVFVFDTDRLVFHLAVVRQDREEAETGGWAVTVEDDAGHQMTPTRVGEGLRRFALNWRLSPYDDNTPTCRLRCVVRVIPGYEAYEGRATYVLADTTPAVASSHVSLVLRRNGQELRFTWRFAPDRHIEHYGQPIGIVVPGPYAEESQK